MELASPLPCTPPVWARGGHAQTLLGHLLPSRGVRIARGAPGVDTREVELADGDRLVVHVLSPHRKPPADDTLVLLFHGLGGSSASDYVRRSASLCLARGHGVLAVNHRGCGEGAGLARGPYHSGRSDDLARCLAWADEHLPHRRRVVIGFSLSGNAALLQLAEARAPSPDAVIAVNPPVDLARASRAISSGANRVYDLRFVAHCRRALAEREAAGLIVDPPSIPRLATLREVDERVTAPYGGFADADDYYARCSTHRRLDDIQVPTVVVSARDDPFVPAESLERAPRGRWVHLHLEDSGGHVGYLARERTGLGTRRWLDYALDHFLGELGK